MNELEQRKQELRDALDELRADKAVVESPLWVRMEHIFKLRYELMVRALTSTNGDNAANDNKIRGRVQEAEYFLRLAEMIKEAIPEIEQELNQLEMEELQQEMQEYAIQEGVD